jgi:phospholipid/cholesterol/gamma-HCH transport system substrate-binding protein
MSRSLANLERASAQLDGTLAGINTALNRVNQGPGFAHDVIYGEGPTDAIAQFGRASGELATTLEGIRKGNGLAHSVLYGDDSTQQLIGDLNAITRDVKEIVAGVRAGKGTVGALMVDPSVYEDIKLLLGNVERNKTLRALVRYSIERDHKPATVQVRDPHQSEGAAEATTGASGKIGRGAEE